MFKKFTNGCVRVVNRWLPDAFLFAIILSIIVFIGSMCATKMGPLQVLNAWGDSKGFWGLLSFSMQMALVLVFGSAMAAAKPCKKALRAAAGLCHNNMQAIVVTTFISTICCWLNWGFGLIAGTLLAKEVVRRVPTVDYPLLIASAYSGFVIWHAGLSGSIPLDLVAGKKFGEVLYQAPITDTVFHPMNLIMVGVILFVMPLVNYAMHPDKDHTVCIDPALLEDEAERTYEVKTPADKVEHSKILWAITLVGGFVYIVYYFVQNGFTLGLNIVNMIFLFLGILLHGDLRRYVDAIGEAAAGAAGILLQFPFYAGIMGMMVAANEQGVSLASVISQFFVNISNSITFPMLSFLAAGIVNFFVPSGGGQWAVQGPIMMPAGANLGIDAGRTAMAIAWGDQWTNMIQPFWALPGHRSAVHRRGGLPGLPGLGPVVLIYPIHQLRRGAAAAAPLFCPYSSVYALLPIDGGVKVPHQLLALGVHDLHQVELLKGQAHGEVLGLVDVVGLEKGEEIGPRNVFLFQQNLKAHGVHPPAYVVYLLVYPRRGQNATARFAQNPAPKTGKFAGGENAKRPFLPGRGRV